MFTYYLRDGYKTKKQLREEKETKIKKKGGDNPYPGWDALRKEEREVKPAILFTIKDVNGDVVARITGPTSVGMHRVAWNLRYTGFRGKGPLALPGVYSVSAHKVIDDKITPLGKAVKFEVKQLGQPTLLPQDRQKVLAFQMQVGKLQNVVMAANSTLKGSLEELDEMKDALKESTPAAAPKLFEQARKLELQLLDVQIQLTGDQTKEKRDQMAKFSILDRVQTALSGTLSQTYGPTKTHRQQYDIARQQYSAVSQQLRQLIETDLEQLKERLDQAGVRWTKGRGIPELDD